MKRIILAAAVAWFGATLALAQNSASEDEMSSGETIIYSITNDQYTGPERSVTKYNIKDVVITGIDGQINTDANMLRCPMLAQIRYIYVGDDVRLLQINVKIEYRETAHGLLYPVRWTPDRDQEVKVRREFIDGQEQR